MRPALRDGILSIGVAVLAVAYLYSDYLLPHPSSGDPVGPQLFPALVGLGLLGSALLMLVEAGRKRRRLTLITTGHRRPDKRRYAAMVAAAIWTLVYYAVLERVGYLLSTAIFIFVLLLYFNPHKYFVNTAIAAGFAVVVYVLFTKILSVDLPQGFLGF